jgi:hypothetical protein
MPPNHIKKELVNKKSIPVRIMRYIDATNVL